jgi:flagellar assembly factor FliW
MPAGEEGPGLFMLECSTKCFGTVQYQPESAIEFPVGLPGFEGEHRFLVIEQEMNKPIVFLQSLSRPELCFITLPVHAIEPTYQGTLTEDDRQCLGLDEKCQLPSGGLLWLGIVALAENGPATINMLSPVVIHCAARRAVQAIQIDSTYSHRHPLKPAGTEASCW